MRKSLALVLCFLLVCSMIIPASMGYNMRNKVQRQPSTFCNGNTLYVGGGGPGNYSTIQSAINDALDGDTVFVYNGTYFENVEITKKISLIGENKNKTIIDGYSNGNVVSITNESVTIKDFTIQNSKYQFAGIRLFYYNHYNTVINNNIVSNSYGIICDHSYYNNIQFNCLDNNEFYGIELRWGRYNNISYNSIRNSDGPGIILTDSSSFNDISNNLITLNRRGIQSQQSSINNNISGNIIYKNGIGIFLASDMNNIFENDITHCSGHGLNVVTCENNIIYHNNLISNDGNVYDVYTSNQYDNGETGNYWDDYTGEDNNDDGIGDTPHPIPKGDNEDRYPLMKPWSGSLPPVKPEIKGRRMFKVGEVVLYPYTIHSTDPDGDDVCYLINWSDGTQEWTGYYLSGEKITITVDIPLEKGNYEIFKIKAIDIFGAESDWTTLAISVPRTKTSYCLRFLDMFPILEIIIGFFR